MYAGSTTGDHEHKFQVTELTGRFDPDQFGNTGIQQCIHSEQVNNDTITYLSSDEGCICKEIGDYAFAATSMVSYINMPTVLSVGTAAFMSNMLDTIILDKCLIIGQNAFAGNNMAKLIKIPSAVDIGEGAFSQFGSIEPEVKTVIDLSENENFSRIEEGVYREKWGISDDRNVRILFYDSQY